jgi:hypothetical protein
MLQSKPTRKIPEYKRNLDWSRIANQACRLHDHLMDGLKAFSGFNLDDGCRSVDSEVAEGIKIVAKDHTHRMTVEYYIKRR